MFTQNVCSGIMILVMVTGGNFMSKMPIIMHIDVNSAFLSWEACYRLQHGDTLDLRTIPSIVGGNPETRRGIVLAKSIPAKKYNIKTGESIYSALQKCPDLTIVAPRFDLYLQCSDSLMKLLKEYSPIVQRYSIDECFLDYSNMESHFGDPLSAACQIKDRIKNELGFTVNIGISHNKLLAKMASDFKKPDAVHTLYPHEIKEKMWPLPVENLFMVGRATKTKLHKLGIFTIKDLATADPKFLEKHLKSHGLLIWNFANGIENSPVISENPKPIKGIGNSTTIPFDVTDRKTAHLILLSLVETVSMRLRNENARASLISVSIRTSDFKNYSHQKKLANPTDCTNHIFKYVCCIFDEVWTKEPIRKLGVRVSELSCNQFSQISLFDSVDTEKQKSVDKAIDELRLRYGSHCIFRAGFLQSNLNPVTGGITIEEDLPMLSSKL